MYNLEKIKLFKYHELIGFFINISGHERFIIDRVHTPYTYSLMNYLNDGKGNLYRNIKHGVIMLTDSGLQTFRDNRDITNHFFYIGGVSFSSIEKTHILKSTLKEREEKLYGNNNIR